jgi:diaminohydroxyphosphoribosylaminopyrimidine deaminase/5-amino-6-(5-phosphoribosylamino)uracil reductase
MFIDAAYAHLCSLSRAGLGVSTPNPNVSAAIYSADEKLIADGFHNRTNSVDHAEIIALKKAGAAARGATLVVSLEPCAHTGATPPCVDAIIEAGIAKVIYAIADPNPIAAGGAQKLKDAGIVVEHCESPDLEFVQRAWLHKEKTGRPLVDNPHLIPRGHAARPVRIVCGEQVVPPTHRIFDSEARTISVKSKSIPELIKVLSDEGFNQVLVEAGPTLGSALMASGKIDELIMYQAPKMLGAGKEFVSHLGISTLEDHMELELLSVAQFGGDIKSHYKVMGR